MRSANARHAVAVGAIALTLVFIPSLAAARSLPSVPALPAIASMVDAAKAGTFNTLIGQVRGRGDSYFVRGIEPRPATLAAQAASDLLEVTIARAHDAGLR